MKAMSVPFIDRNPYATEEEQLRLVISSFCDGSGMLAQQDGTTLPGWRDFERTVATILDGIAPEGKGIFDVLVKSPLQRNMYYGISVKSKELKRKTAIIDLNYDGRVYMVISNAAAKFWDALHDVGISEDDFKNKSNPRLVGDTIIGLVNSWHDEARHCHPGLPNNCYIDIENSIHLVISYSPPRGGIRDYQWHSFDLNLPTNLDWHYKSERCLSAKDPLHPSKDILDWYAFSGGQLKYYPRARECNYCSGRFQLAKINTPISLIEKTARYWPHEWLATGRTITKTPFEIANELEVICLLITDRRIKKVLQDTIIILKRL